MPAAAAGEPPEGGYHRRGEEAGGTRRMNHSRGRGGLGDRPLHAIVFDFDGVIANSEPLHLKAFQQALADEGVELSARDYYSRYLGYDDVGMFQALARDRGIAMSDRHVTALVTRKGAKLQAMLHAGSVLFPGAADFIRQAAAAVPIAIASGALRHEIDEITDAAGLSRFFTVVVASGDT